MSCDSAIERMECVARDANQTARELAQLARPVIRVVGHDAPYELIRAAGLIPIWLVPDMALNTPQADRLIGRANLGQKGRSLLEQILAERPQTPIVITHADNELPPLFAALRELMRNGDIPPRPVHFLDLLHMPRDSSERYNRVRLEQLRDWLEHLSGRTIAPADESGALALSREMTALLQRARTLRDSETPLIGGDELYAMIAAACATPAEQWLQLMRSALDETGWRRGLPGTRLVITGATQFNRRQHRSLCGAGFQIVGDLTDCGDPLIDSGPVTEDWVTSLSDPERRRPLALIRAEERVGMLEELAIRNKAGHVLFLVSPEDLPSAWDAGVMTRMLRARGLQAAVWHTDLPLGPPHALFAEPGDVREDHDAQAGSTPADRAPKPGPARGQRSRKSLTSVADFNTFQKNWFSSVRDQVAKGSPLGLVNADSPQEIIRAMEVPFVVNQWWASIVAAKQQSGRYATLLRKQGYPSDIDAYSAQGLAAAFDDDAALAPWGGLPRPDFVHTVLATDTTSRIYDHWAREVSADLFMFQRTVDPRLDIGAEWWARLPEHWDEDIEAVRLDLLTEELKAAVAAIEARTGRRFDEEKFVEIMALVNEQEEFYRLTRDLIARTHPAPVSIVDTMPATMVPQWHRGTAWARDAARAFHEEVKSLVEQGNSACPDERLRLMWVGRGMWSDMGFYQRWQDSHGAVFVWSMYLGLAADGYVRYFDRERDPLRALAARFVTMGDELRMPTWAGSWYVKEARTHGCHGAVALSDADPFVLRALTRAGIPVLALDLDNFEQDSGGKEADARIAAFLDTLGRPLPA